MESNKLNHYSAAAWCGRIGKGFGRISAVLQGVVLLGGCGDLRVNKSPAVPGEAGAVKEAMRRKDKIVFLSVPELEHRKPILLLLHGATDDPSEMMGIVAEYREQCSVLLYAYNYHQPIKKVAADLNGQLKILRARMLAQDLAGLTIVTYSYSASVFREAVLKADDAALFSGVSLIQVVPTAAGSYLARGLKNPLAAWFTGLASKPSAVENPYGRIAAELWGAAGNRKFCERIPAGQVQSILIQEDPHSVDRIQNAEIRRRYRNGIGDRVMVIPKSRGATHEYFPNEPFARGYLRKAVTASFTNSPPVRDPVAFNASAPVDPTKAGLNLHFENPPGEQVE